MRDLSPHHAGTTNDPSFWGLLQGSIIQVLSMGTTGWTIWEEGTLPLFDRLFILPILVLGIGLSVAANLMYL